MKKILNVYRFVKTTNAIILKADKNHDVQFKPTGYSSTHPSTQNVKNTFRKKYNNSSVTDVNRICKNAIKGGYLRGITLQSGNHTADGLCLEEKGEDLLDSVPFLPFLKIGLLEAILERHGKIVSAAIGLVLGSVPTIVWVVSRIIEAI